MDVNSQFQGLLKEMEFVNRRSTGRQSQCFDNIDYVFKKYFI